MIDINKSNDPEKSLYNSELKQNKDNTNESEDDQNSLLAKENPHFEADKPVSHDQEQDDFSKIPEKYIPNGKVFLRNKKYFSGLGELTIQNGIDNDAVLKLVPDVLNKSVLTIYIRRNSNFTIKRIKDGDYKLFFVVGKHYNEDSSIFLQDCSFSEFKDDFSFIEIKDYEENKTEYSIFEITLYPVAGGTAKTDVIDKKKFLMF